MVDMSANTSIFDRACDAILDHGGTSIYGDERDRYHWYEAIAVGASIQWIAIPWSLAILAAIDADRFGPALWTMFVVWVVPLLVMNAYAQRHKAAQPAQLDGKGRATAIATSVPVIAFLAIMMWPSDGRSFAPLVGAAIGGTTAAIATGLVKRRRR